MRRSLVLPVLLSGTLAASTVPSLAMDKAGSARSDRVEIELRSILERDEISLPSLFRIAELTSPAIAAARIGVEAQAGRVRQAGIYANPVVGVEIEEASLDDFDNRKEKISIAQPILVGNRRGPAVRAAALQLEVTKDALERTRRELRRGVHALWLEVLHERSVESAASDLIVHAKRTHEIAEKRFRARAAPESHVTKARLELYELELLRERAERERERASLQLNALLGGTVVPGERLTGSIEPLAVERDLASLTERLIGSHPAIAEARRGVEAAGAQHRWVRAARLPDLDVHAAWGRHVALDEAFVEAGVEVALPLFDRSQGRVEEARARTRQAEEDARRIKGELVARLAGAHQRHRFAESQLRAHRESILPAAERGLEQAHEGYRSGRLPFLELIDAQRTLTQVRIRTLDLSRELDLATLEVSSLVGLGPYLEAGETP